MVAACGADVADDKIFLRGICRRALPLAAYVYISFTSAVEKVFDYGRAMMYNETVTSVGLGTPDNQVLLIR